VCSCQILDLLSQALDLLFDFHGLVNQVGVRCLRADGIGFSMHFLQQEVESLPHIAPFVEGIQELGIVAAKTDDLLSNIAAIREQCYLHRQAGLIQFPRSQQDFNTLPQTGMNLFLGALDPDGDLFNTPFELGQPTP